MKVVAVLMLFSNNLKLGVFNEKKGAMRDKYKLFLLLIQEINCLLRSKTNKRSFAAKKRKRYISQSCD
jgi:hypothetical protein